MWYVCMYMILCVCTNAWLDIMPVVVQTWPNNPLTFLCTCIHTYSNTYTIAHSCMCVGTVLVTRNFTKSDEFRAKFCMDCVRISQSFCAANHGIAVLPWRVSPISAKYYFAVRRMILRCPHICPYKVNVFVLRGRSLLYTNMAHKLHTGSK